MSKTSKTAAEIATAVAQQVASEAVKVAQEVAKRASDTAERVAELASKTNETVIKLSEDISHIKDDVRDIKTDLKDANTKYITQTQHSELMKEAEDHEERLRVIKETISDYATVKLLVYSAVGIILTAVLGAIVYLVIEH